MTYINPVTYDTAWGEVEVRELEGYPEFHVFTRGARYDVFVEEGEEGWFTEIAVPFRVTIEGPRDTAAEIIDEFFVKAPVPPELRHPDAAVIQHEDGTQTVTSYETVRVHQVGDLEPVEVRKVTERDWYHVLITGDETYNVWRDPGDGLWYTDVTDGSYATDDALISDIFLNPDY